MIVLLMQDLVMWRIYMTIITPDIFTIFLPHNRYVYSNLILNVEKAHEKEGVLISIVI